MIFHFKSVTNKMIFNVHL